MEYERITPQELGRRRRAVALLDAVDDRFDRFLGRFEEGADPPLRLRFPSVMTEERMLRAHERADWDGVPSDLRYFGASVVEAARRRGVPLFVSTADPAYVTIAHGIFGAALSPLEWRWIRSIGVRLAERKRLDVEPCANEVGVFLWRGPPAERAGGVVRLTPRRILADMRGR